MFLLLIFLSGCVLFLGILKFLYGGVETEGLIFTFYLSFILMRVSFNGTLR